MNLNRLENETFTEYKIRICLAKLDKEIDLDWCEVRDLLGINQSDSHLRKVAYGYREYREKIKIDNRCTLSDEEVIKEIEEKTLELQKERYKLADAKREVNKKIREAARRELISEEVVQAIQNVNSKSPLQVSEEPIVLRAGNNEAILMLSDWHYGLEVDNYWNKFNVSILEKRVSDIVAQVKEHLDIYGVNKIHIVLNGDFINGNIHTTLRIMSQMDIIDQTVGVAELLANTIHEISKFVEEVNVYSSIGNHSRLSENLKESLTSENMERLIYRFIKERLKFHKNIKCLDNIYDCTMVTFDVFNEKIFASHGDKDHCNSVINNMNKMLDFNPTVVLLGHIHHFTSKDFGSGTVITGGSLIGMDDYTVNKRIYGKPYQNMVIINDKLGKIATIDLKVK